MDKVWDLLEIDSRITGSVNTNPSKSILESHSLDFAIEVVFLRVGLASAGGLLLHLAFIVMASTPLSRSPGDLLILIVNGTSGLLLLVAAGIRRPPDSLRWLILLAYAEFFALLRYDDASRGAYYPVLNPARG